MEKINVVGLLEDCPRGMELDCILWDNVTFERVAHNGIWINYLNDKNYKYEIYLDNEGCLPVPFLNLTTTKCVIFPKGKTTWEGFIPPCKFKDGDIVSTQNGIWIGIVKRQVNTAYETYITINGDSLAYNNAIFCFEKLATEEEKEKLFQAIKANGYKWNAETKTLEKLPKFKVGDKVRGKYTNNINTISCITSAGYELTNGQLFPFNAEDCYELVPDKFDITTLKPFESRVLVRNANNKTWRPSLFGCYRENKYEPFYVLGGTSWKQCIPYEGNEHLLSTTNDCDEFYKTWE